MNAAQVLSDLGLHVLERGWLSSNNIVATGPLGVDVVDTGYHAHARQTVALIEGIVGEVELKRVFNTHLHSDHCGGNAALQARWGCEVLVPAASKEALSPWDDEKLTFDRLDQHCDPFSMTGCFDNGDVLTLGRFEWLVISAPGHDPDAVMLFQEQSRVLISADALWEKRLAIIFPELAGEPGFDDALAVLDLIEALEPRLVIPGHGRPFVDVAAAIAQSRRRIERYQADPVQHLLHAVRALAVFRMMEIRTIARAGLLQWLVSAAAMRQALNHPLLASRDVNSLAGRVVDGLLSAGILSLDDGDMLTLTQ